MGHTAAGRDLEKLPHRSYPRGTPMPFVQLTCRRTGPLENANPAFVPSVRMSLQVYHGLGGITHDFSTTFHHRRFCLAGRLSERNRVQTGDGAIRDRHLGERGSPTLERCRPRSQSPFSHGPETLLTEQWHPALRASESCSTRSASRWVFS